MRLIEHSIDSSLTRMDNRQLLEVVSECVNIIDFGINCIEITESDDVDDYDIVTPPCNAIKTFSMNFVSENFLANKVIQRAVGYKYDIGCLSRINSILDKIIENDQVTTKLKTELSSEAFIVVANVSAFLANEFELIKTREEYDTLGSEASVDVIINAYCTENNVNIIEFADKYISIMKEYRVQLGILEMYPELSDPFYEIMGPSVNLLDDEKLTLEHVKGLINGTMTIEQVLRETDSVDFDDICEDANGNAVNNMNVFR